MNHNRMNKYCPPCGHLATHPCRKCHRSYCGKHVHGHKCRPSNHAVAVRLIQTEDAILAVVNTILPGAVKRVNRALLWAGGVVAVLFAVLFWLELSG